MNKLTPVLGIGLLVAVSQLGAISMCQPYQVASGQQPGWSNPSTCKAATAAPTSTTLPIAAILQPALEQDDDLLKMAASQYRYIALPVNQAYIYRLYDDDPSQAINISVKPVYENDQLALQFGLSGGEASSLIQLAIETHKKNSSQSAAKTNKSTDTPTTSCSFKMLPPQATCPSFSEFASTIEPVVQHFDQGDSALVQAWASLQPDLIKPMLNAQQQPYLSVRYVNACGGTLVADNLVLTAAHCLSIIGEDNAELDPSALHNVAVFGSNWQGSDAPIYPVDAVNLRENPTDYISSVYLSSANEAYDYALMPLQTKVSGITPAQVSVGSESKGQFYVAGFGMTEPVNEMSWSTDTQLRHAMSSAQLLYGPATPVAGKNACLTLYVDAGLIPPNTQPELGFNDLICAGTSSEVSYCSGDSGSPLFALGANNDWQTITVYGLVAGKPAQCQNSIINSGKSYNIPGLYTKLDHYCDDGALTSQKPPCSK